MLIPCFEIEDYYLFVGDFKVFGEICITQKTKLATCKIDNLKHKVITFKLATICN